MHEARVRDSDLLALSPWKLPHSSKEVPANKNKLLKLTALYCSWSILITSLPLASLWGTLRGRVLKFFDDTQRSGVLWSVSRFPHGTEHQPTWEGGPVPTATQQLWEKEWHLLRIEGGKPTLSKNILTFSQTTLVTYFRCSLEKIHEENVQSYLSMQTIREIWIH